MLLFLGAGVFMLLISLILVCHNLAKRIERIETAIVADVMEVSNKIDTDKFVRIQNNFYNNGLDGKEAFNAAVKVMRGKI
jgi:hypothetical protein